MSTRKQYTKAFKLDAVSLVLDQDYTRAEAARSLAIMPICSVAGFKSMKAMKARPSGATAN